MTDSLEIITEDPMCRWYVWLPGAVTFFVMLDGWMGGPAFSYTKAALASVF